MAIQAKDYDPALSQGAEISSDNIPAGTVVESDISGLDASFAEINRTADVSARIVNVTDATLAIALATHEGKIVTINRAAGCDVTLPAASGSGAWYRFFVGTTVTSNDITFVVTGDDTYEGFCIQAADGGSTVNVYEAAGTNRITLDGTTKGGIKGDIFEFADVAADLWMVNAKISSTGTEASPFSTV